MNRSIAFFVVFLVCIIGFGAVASANDPVPSFVIVPEESHLHFTATQNDAPVAGEFTQFDGEIRFDPERLDESYVRIVVKMDSVSVDHQDTQEALKTADWFDITQFPEAVYESEKIVHIGGDRYEAHGTLTIRGVTIISNLSFYLRSYSETHALVEGSGGVNRTRYSIGQGEWSSTDVVSAWVPVEFTVSAKRK